MKYLYLLITLLFSFIINGQSIIGHWETYDDVTQERKANIEIYKTDDVYFARIVESYVSDKNATCKNCEGERKNQPINGLIIIENIVKDGNEYNGGTILDPENGKFYKCYLELVEKNKLKVRGYIGVSLFGRTQYWLRKE